MNLTDHGGPGHPGLGSTGWAASRIERLLEDEARRRRMAWADEARHRTLLPRPPAPTRNVHPVGSTAWGAQEMLRRLKAADSGTGDDAGLGPEDLPAETISQTEIPPMVTNRAPRYRGELMPGLRGEPLLSNQETSELAFSTVPLIGDAYGLYRDIETFVDDPASRTWGNYALAGAGLLPVIPSGLTRVGRKVGNKLEDILAANPRTIIEEIPADATGRLGKPVTRKTVIRVADAFQKHLDSVEPGRFALIAGGGRKERAIQPVGYDGYKATRLAQGAQFGDIMFLDTKTGKQLIVQVARVTPNGRPIAEELDTALRIARTPTRIPRPYRDDERLMELPIHGQHSVIVVAPPADW